MGQVFQQTTNGYRTDVGYSTHYQPQLHPHRLTIAAALSGGATFDPGQPFTMFDHGCGFGLTTLCHAAAYPDARFIGIDARDPRTSLGRRRWPISRVWRTPRLSARRLKL